MSKTSVAPKPAPRKTPRFDRASLNDMKLLLRYSAEQLVPSQRFAVDLQQLIDLVDYRARRPRACPIDVWLDLRFRSRELQDSLRRLTGTLKVACAFLEVGTKPEPHLVDWLRHQLRTLAVLRGYEEGDQHASRYHDCGSDRSRRSRVQQHPTRRGETVCG